MFTSVMIIIFIVVRQFSCENFHKKKIIEIDVFFDELYSELESREDYEWKIK